MNLEIRIIADTNDGDYVTEISEISEEDLEKIKPLIKAIKDYKDGYNWPTGIHMRMESPEKAYKGIVIEDTFRLFKDLLPCGGEYGIHTISSIIVCPIVEKTVLL